MADEGLAEISGRLLIQCRPHQAHAAVTVARAWDAGLVLTGKALEPAVRALRDGGFAGPLLCDADRYSGGKRVSAATGVHPAWIRRQAGLGLLPLTDSGYVAARNVTALRTVLRAAAQQQSLVVAMLPLAARWFATKAICEALVREINSFGVPVALAIEHSGDPFGVQRLVRWFLHLLATTTVPVILLRSDVAALGALCHGAHAAAVGTISALRHTYPKGPRRAPRLPGVSAFVTPLLAYHRLETLETVFAKTPDLEQLWPCECPVCDGRTPAVLAAEEEPATLAFLHSLHALLGLRADLRRVRTPEAMASAWHEHCSHALHVHDQVAEIAPAWRAPAGVRSWLKVTDDPMQRTIPVQPESDRTIRANPDPRLRPGAAP